MKWGGGCEGSRGEAVPHGVFVMVWDWRSGGHKFKRRSKFIGAGFLPYRFDIYRYIREA